MFTLTQHLFTIFHRNETMAPQAEQKLNPNKAANGALTGDEHQVKTKKEVLYNNYFYDVTDWVRRHPGGRIIEFYTKSGEDATLAIQEFHQRSAKKVNVIMSSLKKRPAEIHERK